MFDTTPSISIRCTTIEIIGSRSNQMENTQWWHFFLHQRISVSNESFISSISIKRRNKRYFLFRFLRSMITRIEHRERKLSNSFVCSIFSLISVLTSDHSMFHSMESHDGSVISINWFLLNTKDRNKNTKHRYLFFDWKNKFEIIHQRTISKEDYSWRFRRVFLIRW